MGEEGLGEHADSNLSQLCDEFTTPPPEGATHPSSQSPAATDAIGKGRGRAPRRALAAPCQEGAHEKFKARVSKCTQPEESAALMMLRPGKMGEVRGWVVEVAEREPWRGGAWVYSKGVFKEEEGRKVSKVSPGLKMGRDRVEGVEVGTLDDAFQKPWNPVGPFTPDVSNDGRTPYKGEDGVAKDTRVDSRAAG